MCQAILNIQDIAVSKTLACGSHIISAESYSFQSLIIQANSVMEQNLM